MSVRCSCSYSFVDCSVYNVLVHAHINSVHWTLYGKLTCGFSLKTADWVCSRHSVLIRVARVFVVIGLSAPFSYIRTYMYEHSFCSTTNVFPRGYTVHVFSLFFSLSFMVSFSQSLCDATKICVCAPFSDMHIEAIHYVNRHIFLRWLAAERYRFFFLSFIWTHTRARFMSEGLTFSWVRFFSILTDKNAFKKPYGSNEKWQYDLLDIEFLLPLPLLEDSWNKTEKKKIGKKSCFDKLLHSTC